MPTATRGDHGAVLLDASTAVAPMVEDHEGHALTIAAVGGRRLGLAGHAWFETYSVLTRLPWARRRALSDALRLLSHDFPASRFLGEETSAELGPAGHGGSGGAVYEALVAGAARHHGERLRSAGTRARSVYEALRVDLELIDTSRRR